MTLMENNCQALEITAAGFFLFSLFLFLFKLFFLSSAHTCPVCVCKRTVILGANVFHYVNISNKEARI